MIALSIAVFHLSSCKKEIVEVPVNPFIDLKAEVMYEDGAYTISYHLQDYPYKEVGLMLTLDRNAFFNRFDLYSCPTYETAKGRFKSYLNDLRPNTTYYYQVYVKDSRSTKEAYSEIYTFKTTP